jgi:hypothetical protein
MGMQGKRSTTDLRLFNSNPLVDPVKHDCISKTMPCSLSLRSLWEREDAVLFWQMDSTSGSDVRAQARGSHTSSTSPKARLKRYH